MTRFPATRCEGKDNVLCSRFQRVVFAVSTCCVWGFDTLRLSWEKGRGNGEGQ